MEVVSAPIISLEFGPRAQFGSCRKYELLNNLNIHTRNLLDLKVDI